ncbi:MAG: hypothetical protein MUE68_05060 [Bacteroidetes bacterium]|jgi:hypothetical protein|nr:hypothetical protein [Bacteroidota bacterium]
MTSANVAAFLLPVPLLSLDCQQPGEPLAERSGPVVQFSFESDADTTGWSGYGGYRFAPDVPLGGGRRSFEVSGGCIVRRAMRCVVLPRHGPT